MNAARMRTMAVALALTVLPAVVAIAGRESLNGAGTQSRASTANAVTPLFVLLVGGGLLAVGVTGSLFWRRPRRRHPEDEPPRVPTLIRTHWTMKLAVIVMPLAAGCALIAAAILGTHQAFQPDGSGSARPQPSSFVEGQHAGRRDEVFTMPAWLPWMLAAIVAALVITAAAVLLRRPRPPADAGTDDETADARAAVEAAMEPLRVADDPRGAVIAAYVRMEQTLAERQLARRAPEAPREYLERVLREHAAPEAPLTNLTTLFEEARFSRHPIPTSAPPRALTRSSRFVSPSSEPSRPRHRFGPIPKPTAGHEAPHAEPAIGRELCAQPLDLTVGLVAHRQASPSSTARSRWVTGLLSATAESAARATSGSAPKCIWMPPRLVESERARRLLTARRAGSTRRHRGGLVYVDHRFARRDRLRRLGTDVNLRASSRGFSAAASARPRSRERHGVVSATAAGAVSAVPKRRR